MKFLPKKKDNSVPPILLIATKSKCTVGCFNTHAFPVSILTTKYTLYITWRQFIPAFCVNKKNCWNYMHCLSYRVFAEQQR